MRTIILILIILFPQAALAGGYLIPSEDARELGLSQSTVAAQTGPEAAFQNTAALAGVQGFGFAGSLELLFNNTTWTDPTLGTASINTRVNTPPALSASYGGALEGGMRYGFGVNLQVPGGGSLYWPYNWPGATRIQSVHQMVFLTTVGGGFEPIRGIRIGASARYFRVTEELTQQLNFVGQRGLASLGLGGGALTYGVSAELRAPGIPVTLGFDYTHKANMKLEGNAHFDNIPPSFSSLLIDQGATEQISTPNVMHLGAAWEIQSGLRLMGAWTFERWEEYRSDTFVGTKGFAVTVPRNYVNANVFRLGVEWAHLPFLPALTLRAGGLRDISPQPVETISPSLTDANSWAFSVGAGYDIIPELQINVGWQHAILDTVTASGTEAFPGAYSTNVNLVSFGLTYRSAPESTSLESEAAEED